MAIGTPEIFVLIIIAVVIWFLFFRGHRQQQQQQQVVIQNSGEKKNMRVCPKCGMQNDKDAKFCNDCGFKFT
ncbi:MAG: zinc-ribbon domain-containing protein [Candidatus Methanoperedens sp.]|nr:zinc-ribbon domain-containing protein [Candidatus Methanoperedens sp.]